MKKMPDVEIVSPYEHRVMYEEGAVRWCQWCLMIPKYDNPLSDVDGSNCANGQGFSDKWYLAGSFGIKSKECVRRKCSVPLHSTLFFPVITEIATAIESSENNIRHVASSEVEEIWRIMSRSENWEVTLDGKELVADLMDYHFQSSEFELALPIDNILNLQPGYTRAVTDGFWIMVKPLSAGSHILHFGTDFDSKKGTIINGEVTYELLIR